jgi:hypothetical protein
VSLAVVFVERQRGISGGFIADAEHPIDLAAEIGARGEASFAEFPWKRNVAHFESLVIGIIANDEGSISGTEKIGAA